MLHRLMQSFFNSLMTFMRILLYCSTRMVSLVCQIGRCGCHAMLPEGITLRLMMNYIHRGTAFHFHVQRCCELGLKFGPGGLPEHNPREQYKLKDLVRVVLSQDIQGHSLQAHDSIEDAWAAMQLYVLNKVINHLTNPINL